MRLDLPSAARNPISLIGTAIATAMAVLFLVLIALEFGGQLDNPYLGLLLFVSVPVTGVQSVYARNIFPAMKVGWGTYPINMGHVAFQGCFRCHDENHKATDGTAIAQDCQSCHAMP